MKIILSRKGFDSSNGGHPSPIFPDGRMYSFPIKGIGEPKCYADLRKGSPTDSSELATVLEQLSNGRFSRIDRCHFDPDLDEAALPRLPGWRPSFGQASAAQGHLQAMSVGPGDLFLFYGWFRRVGWYGARWGYKPGAPDLHVIFGWLQVGEAIMVPDGDSKAVVATRSWLRDHPHVHLLPGEVSGNNVIYTAADRLCVADVPDRPGGGEFHWFHPRLVLTAPGATRSCWDVPAWFMGGGEKPCLSYHDDPGRWTLSGDRAVLRTVGRGQEFVLDCSGRPEAENWIAGLFDSARAVMSGGD